MKDTVVHICETDHAVPFSSSKTSAYLCRPLCGSPWRPSYDVIRHTIKNAEFHAVKYGSTTCTECLVIAALAELP